MEADIWWLRGEAGDRYSLSKPRKSTAMGFYSSFFFFLYEGKQMITLFPTLPSEKQGKEYLCRTHTTGLQGGFPA